ncbi:hypothetical protein Tco_0350216 [Tanacetum coccineum]
MFEIPPYDVIIPDLPSTDSPIMEDEHLDTILKTKSDEEIESSVKNLFLIPSESKDLSDKESECGLPVWDESPSESDDSFSDSMTFSKPLFDSSDDFTSSDDESLFKEDVPVEIFRIYSNSLFEFKEDYISSKINPLFNEI